MQQTISMKPQDIAVLVKLILQKNKSLRQIDLAIHLGLSQGEIAKSFQRLNKSKLLQDMNVNKTAALEFILHAIKYVFPAELGPLAVGVPTGISFDQHEKMVVQSGEDIYVWPLIDGKKRGQSIKPFYPKLAEAALKDSDFHAMMAAIEILRVGRTRERKLAEQYIEKRINKT